MERLLEYLNSIQPLSEDLCEQLREVVQRRNLKRGEIFLCPGEICRNMYYIESGLIRCYHFKNGNGMEITSFFMGANDICVEVFSFYKQIRSTKFLQAIEDTTLFFISKRQLDAIFDVSMEFNKIAREQLIKYLCLWDQKLDNVLAASASERLQALQDQFPDWEERIHDQYKASYLGMLPSSFSRVKNQLFREYKKRKVPIS